MSTLVDMDIARANRLTTHAYRDMLQRAHARKRYQALRRSLPKRVRERDVRKEKLAARTHALFGGVQEQGLGTAVAAVGVAGSLLMMNRVTNTVAAVGNQAVRLLRGGESTLGSVNKLVKEVAKLLDTVVTTARAIVGKLWVIPLGVLGYWLISKFAGSTATILVISTALSLLFGKKLWASVSEHFGFGMREQSGLGDNLKAIIVSLMCFSFLPSGGGGRLMMTLMSRIALVPRLGAGIDGLMKAAVSIAESVINLVHRMAGHKDADGNDRVVFFGDETTKHVKQWLYESYRHMEKLLDKPQPEAVKKAYEHIRVGYATMQVIKDQDLVNVLKRGVDNLETKVAPFMGVVTAGKNFRPEPHFVLFSGESGVGKSSILIKFVVSVLLLSGLCDPNEVLSNLWQKGSSEYWNGYVNQLCVVMDDVFQKISAKGDTDSEYMDIIRMISNWSYPLNMADLNSKGKFYFDSPLVVGTTNAPNVYDTTFKEAIAKPEAVVRRIHDVVYIRAAEGFRREDNTMDYEKLELTFRANIAALKERGECQPADIVDAIPWHAWEAQRADFHKFTFPSHGTALTNPLSLKDLVVNVAERLKRKQAYHSESLNTLEEFAELLGKAKLQEQAGLTTEANLKDFLDDYTSISGEFEPALNASKLRALALRVKRNRSTLLQPFMRKDIDDLGGLDKFYRLAMLLLIKMFHDETLGDLGDSSRAAIVNWCKLFSAECGGKESRFLDTSTVDVPELRKRISFVVDLLADHEKCEAIGLNTSGHTSLYSWVKSLGDEFAIFADAYVVAQESAKRELTLVKMARSFVTGLWDSIKQLDAIGFRTKLLTAAGCVLVVRLLLKGVTKVISVVIKAICGLIGVDLGDKTPKIEVVEPKLIEQGNHVSVLQDEEVYNKIYANTYTMFLPRPEKVLGHLLFVTSNLCIMPSHFDRQVREHMENGLLNEEDQIVCYNGAMKFAKISMTIKQFLSVPRYKPQGVVTDAMFLSFQLESNFMAKATIRQHFAPADSFQAIGRSVLPARMDLTRLVCDKGTVKLQRAFMTAPIVKREYGLPIGPITPDFVWSTGMTTRLGDCGAPLMIARRSSAPKGKCIIGVHVAGNTCPIEPKACAIPVSAEMVEEAIAHFSTIDDQFEQDLAQRGITITEPTVAEQSGIFESGLVGGSFELIGLVDKPVAIAPKTRFSHTPLHKDKALGECDLKIAHLGPTMVNGELKYPMVEGIRNYQSPLEWRSIPDLDHIIAIATQRFVAASVHDTRDILSFEEAVKSPELLKLKAINRATSPGYPFVLDGEPGKTKWFGKEGEYDLTSEACEELFARCEYIRDQAAKGIRLSHICIDFLKDETRPAAKVDACATRVISASPQDYVIVFRQYFGAFMAAMFRNHTRSGFTPGINPYQEWWVLANELKSGGENFFDGDFSRFDASEQPYILWGILRFINSWYHDGPENARIREVLWMDLVHSRHLTAQFGPLRYVVQWNKSLPSGHALTTPVNSLYAMISMVLCYARLVGDPSSYWEHCYTATNGDDNITAADDDVKDRFNQVTVAAAMKEYLGLTYTSGSKDGKLEPFKPFDELTFLKRSFRRDEGNEFVKGGWLAPLDKNSFLYSAYFTRAKTGVAADIASNLEFALGELCLHPESEWNEIAPKIYAAMDRFGYAPKYGYSRTAYMQYMSRRTDFWY